MNKIYRAGLIPFYEHDDGKIEMFFMKPSDPHHGGSDYQIAKGKIEPNENAREAAIREAGEELGFTMLNAKETVCKIGNFLGRTEFFIVEVKSKEMFNKPHFETGSTKWFTLEEYIESGRTLHQPVVKAAYRKIMELLGK